MYNPNEIYPCLMGSRFDRSVVVFVAFDKRTAVDHSFCDNQYTNISNDMHKSASLGYLQLTVENLQRYS